MADRTLSHDPHHNQPVETAGQSLAGAQAAVILLHGRGATAASILMLAQELDQPAFAYLAPQAAGYTWYPQSFLAPIEQNEPNLSSALALVDDVLRRATGAGVPRERTILLGFSQGACLATEYAARNAGRYGGVVAFSGGLIGPPGTPRDYEGAFEDTPFFFGCSDVDPHIPVERVYESAEVVEAMGATVTTRIYPGMGHTVNEDELEAVRQMMAALTGQEA